MKEEDCRDRTAAEGIVLLKQPATGGECCDVELF